MNRARHYLSGVQGLRGGRGMRAAAAAILLVAVWAMPARAEDQPAAGTETGTKPKEEQAGAGSVTIDPGNGVTFSSADGDYTMNIGFFGQFRGQYLDRDHFRRADQNPSLP